MGNSLSSKHDDAVCSGFRVGPDGNLHFTDLRRRPLSSSDGVVTDKERGSEVDDMEGVSGADKVSLSCTNLARVNSITRPKPQRPDRRRPTPRSASVGQRPKVRKRSCSGRMGQTNSRRPHRRPAMSVNGNEETVREPSDQQPSTQGSPPHQRIMRGRTQVNYDGKYHPMDEVMRPGMVAFRRARQEQRQAEVPSHQSTNYLDTSRFTASDSASVPAHSLSHLAEPTSPPEDDSTPASRLRRRTQGKAPPTYDEQWHPLNMVIDDNNDNEKPEAKSKDPEPRSRGHFARDVISDQHMDDEVSQGIDSDVHSLGVSQQPMHWTEEDKKHPGTRRSARHPASNDDTSLLYSLLYSSRYHPIDKFQRPAQVAKMLERKANPVIATADSCQRLEGLGGPAVTADVDNNLPVQIEETSTVTGSTQLSSISATRSKSLTNMAVENPSPTAASVANRLEISSSSDRKDPHLQQEPVKWESLSDLGRQLYLLQRGGPTAAESDVLPLSWLNVKRSLFEYGDITLDILNSPEGTDALVEQYERVRLGVQAFFGSPEEPNDKKDWIVYRAEGLDVFDRRPKKRYWRSEADQIVQPEMIRMSNDSKLASNTQIAAAASEYSFRGEEPSFWAVPLRGSKKDILNDTCLESPTPLSENNDINANATNVEYDALTASENNLLDSMQSRDNDGGTIATADEVTDMNEMDALLNSVQAQFANSESPWGGSCETSDDKTGETTPTTTGSISTLSAVVVQLPPAHQKSTSSSLSDSQPIFLSTTMKPRYGHRHKGKKRKADIFDIYEDHDPSHGHNTSTAGRMTNPSTQDERKNRGTRSRTSLPETDLPVENLPAGGLARPGRSDEGPSQSQGQRRRVRWAMDVQARSD